MRPTAATNGKQGPSEATNGAEPATPSANGPNGRDGAEQPAAPSTDGSNGRGPGGRFVKGNAGGPGNPFARKVAALRSALIETVSEEGTGNRDLESEWGQRGVRVGMARAAAREMLSKKSISLSRDGMWRIPDPIGRY